MVWYGLAVGFVAGGQQQKSTDTGHSAVGAARSGDSKKSGAQGLFSLWGHQVWLYMGGIVGFGETAGVYLTAGPMIGAESDLAIGGGVHIFKRVGVGVVVPVIHALQAASAYSDQASYLINQANYCAGAVGDALNHAGSSLERMASDPTYIALAGMAVGIAIVHSQYSLEHIVEQPKQLYAKAKDAIVENMYNQ